MKLEVLESLEVGVLSTLMGVKLDVFEDLDELGGGLERCKSMFLARRLLVNSLRYGKYMSVAMIDSGHFTRIFHF